MGVALTASSLSAVAAQYETRILIKTLKVTGSPQPGTGTPGTGTTPGTGGTGGSGTGGTGDTSTPSSKAVTLTPGSTDFGALQVGETSTVRAFLLSNPDTVDKAISDIHVNGADFKLSGNQCGTTLAAGSTCNIGVVMTAGGLGASSGSLSATVAGQVLTASLTGTGKSVDAALQASPASVDFGAGVTGQSSEVKTVSLHNSNDVAVQFSGFSMDSATKANFNVDPAGCGTSLAAGASCNLYVMMTPSQAGALSGSISIVAGGRLTNVALSGSAVAATKSIANSGWTTLTAEPGRPSTGSVALSNTGNSTIRLGAISTGTPYFSITSNECGTELAPEGYCTVTVQFSPNKAGDFADTLTIESDATNNASLQLTGTGIAPQPHLDQISGGYFGTPYVNTTDSTTVVFQNTGQVLTKVGTISYQGTGGTTAPASTVFNVTSDTCTGASLAPGATCNVVVALTGKQEPTSYSMSIYPKYGETGTEATSYGYVGGNFHYMYTAMTATNFGGTFNSTTPDSTPIAFQTSGGTSQRTFTLTSRDSAPGTVTVASSNAPEFVISSNTCLGTLAPNRSCTFVVTFKSAGSGQRAGNINIGGATKMSVSLTGN